ncbi:MAG: hypothetical protein RIU67_1051, partial [Actinomycetota bacterium]
MFESAPTTSKEVLAQFDARAESVSSAAEARELLVELERVKRHLEVTTARLVDRVSATGAFQEDGCLSVATWLRTTVNWPVAEAKRMVRVADLVHDYPQVGALMADGSLASAPVTRLAGLHANKRVTAQLPDFIESMVE